jgi:hypothetical protein
MFGAMGCHGIARFASCFVPIYSLCLIVSFPVLWYPGALSVVTKVYKSRRNMTFCCARCISVGMV